MERQERERKKAKEKAVLLALRVDKALIRRGLEIWAISKDGSTECISKSGEYDTLWSDALATLRKLHDK